MPAMGESVSEGTILEWAKQPGDHVDADETIVEISTDKVDAEVPAPGAGTITEVLADAGDTVTVGQVIARMRRPAASERDRRTRRDGDRAARAHALRARPATPRPSAPPTADSTVTPVAMRVAAAEGVDLGAGPGTGPDGRISKADVLAFKSNGAAATGARAATTGTQTLLKGASAMLARYMDESRAIPTATSFRTLTVTVLDARRKQLKEAGHRVSFTHLIALRDRARGHRADAGDGHPLRRDRRQAARGRRRPGQPRDRRRRREEGRRAHADGAGDQGRRPADVPAVPRRVRRPDRPRARQQADRRRPPGREPVAHQPGRHRHDRQRAAADGRPGHDRRHRARSATRRASGPSAPRSAPRR